MDQIEVAGLRIAYERRGEGPPPTLLLYGDKDVRAPLNVAEALHAAIPGSRLVVLAGVGHVSSIEAAERFNSEIRHFLRGQRQP
jgi:pimeloyl-ACP methyl ester carboxylesterase